jgi:hypothetical protein
MGINTKEVKTMNKYPLIGGSICAVILLVLASLTNVVGYQTVKASTDNDLIEVTSQACGIQGFGNTTVKLTKQQYQDLQNYLVEFRTRLNQTTTREEAVPLFKDAVVELNKYGLLPKGMSVEQAQNLVTLQYKMKNREDIQQKLSHNRLFRLENNSNILCLIAGETTTTFFIGLLNKFLFASSIFSEVVGVLLSTTLLLIPFSLFFILLGDILMFLTFCSWLTTTILPATLLSSIVLGADIPDIVFPGQSIYFPASGWVDTFGLKGRQNFLNDFYGQYTPGLDVGVLGFTGIKIIIPTYKFIIYSFYLGSAVKVKIGPNPAPWPSK